MARANATKRRRLTSARVTPSGFKRPVELSPRARPHIIFSLKSGKTAAPSRSNTTRRSELEPRSMTPMRSAASRAGSVIQSACNKSRVGPPQRLAASGQAGNAGPQAADAADDKIDVHPCLRGPIEEIDDRGIDERIHLRPDLCRLALSGILDLGFDELAEP